MPEIRPFCGIVYDQKKVELSSVVAPPYDVISPQQQRELYDANPYNIVRLELAREEDRYSSAARHFDQWKKEGILSKDEAPSIFVLAQNFVTPDKKYLERRGFIARCKLENFGMGSILPHEKTLAKPKEDRFRLLQATHANFSQIFGLYVDPHHTTDPYLNVMEMVPPVLDVTFEGVRNRLWKLTDVEKIRAIQLQMHDKKILVADGHHRYETALRFRDLMCQKNASNTGEEPHNFTMMYFTNVHDTGLVILPTHRLLHSLPTFDSEKFLEQLGRYFRLTVQKDGEQLWENLREHKRFAFGLILPSKPEHVLFWLESSFPMHSRIDAELPDVVKELDVTILHKLVFERILEISPAAQEQKQNLDYVNDAHEALAAVKEKRAQAAFLMNPTSVEQVRVVAEAGYTMPQKSTYFYPKLLAGIVINSLDED